MKILFIIKALANKGGGAEKVLAHVANGLAKRGHRVAILTSDSVGSVPYYQFSSGVDILNIGIGRVDEKSSARDILRRMAHYRNVVSAERPDAVVAFMHSAYLPGALALLGTRVPVIASEHTGPEHYRNRLLQKLLLQLTPLMAECITVVSEQVRAAFGAWLRSRMIVVPNPVVVNTTGPALRRDSEAPLTVLSVGRLGAEKSHATLIDAFARVAKKHSCWVLRIVGEGHLRGELERQIESAGLTGRALLPGAVSNIDEEYRGADLFVLPSIYESFGMATAEALLHGVPSIGFADCAGTNELIEDGVNGRLVRGLDRVESLSKVLDELMASSEERDRLAHASTDQLSRKVGLEFVLDEWEQLLMKVGRPDAPDGSRHHEFSRMGRR